MHLLIRNVCALWFPGSVNNTWKQGEWEYKPQTNHKFINIKRHEENNNNNNNKNHNSRHHHYRHHNHHQHRQQHTNAFIEDVRDSSDTASAANKLFIDSITECWPKDWLPYDCPNVRISAINYDTDPHLWRPIWYPSRKRTNLMSRANKMIKLLVENRIGENRPIVWVGHSKGGLYIKQIIVSAHMSQMPDLRCLWQSTRGVLFYSVPHSGSPLADLNLPFLTQSIEMIEIRKSKGNLRFLEYEQRGTNDFYFCRFSKHSGLAPTLRDAVSKWHVQYQRVQFHRNGIDAIVRTLLADYRSNIGRYVSSVRWEWKSPRIPHFFRADFEPQ